MKLFLTKFTPLVHIQTKNLRQVISNERHKDKYNFGVLHSHPFKRISSSKFEPLLAQNLMLQDFPPIFKWFFLTYSATPNLPKCNQDTTPYSSALHYLVLKYKNP